MERRQRVKIRAWDQVQLENAAERTELTGRGVRAQLRNSADEAAMRVHGRRVHNAEARRRATLLFPAGHTSHMQSRVDAKDAFWNVQRRSRVRVREHERA
jgi:hypothetical protein